MEVEGLFAGELGDRGYVKSGVGRPSCCQQQERTSSHRLEWGLPYNHSLTEISPAMIPGATWIGIPHKHRRSGLGPLPLSIARLPLWHGGATLMRCGGASTQYSIYMLVYACLQINVGIPAVINPGGIHISPAIYLTFVKSSFPRTAALNTAQQSRQTEIHPALYFPKRTVSVGSNFIRKTIRFLKYSSHMSAHACQWYLVSHRRSPLGTKLVYKTDPKASPERHIPNSANHDEIHIKCKVVEMTS